MNLIIMGAPGAGKGTQATLIKEAYQIPHISTGDMFREAMKNGTEVGLEAKKYIEKGMLVPDSVTNALVKERLSQADCKKGFLLDGFPRNIPQAEALDKIFEELNIKLDAVINIDVDYSILTERIVGRRICPTCGASFHMTYHKPKQEGICDECGGQLVQRKDDNEETIKTRLEVYSNQTKPLLGYYNKQDVVRTVNGEGDVQAIFNNIKNAVGGF